MGIIRFVLFMCGQLGIMLLARFFFQWLVFFCNQPISEKVTLLSVSIVGMVMFGFRIFDGVTDPIAGTLSDIWVKGGRERRQLLWYTSPLPALGLILCFLPSATDGETLRWIYLLSGMLLFFVGYTLYALPYWSLVGDYAQGDEQRRGKLSTLLGVGMLLATTVGFIVTPIMIDHFGYLNSAFILALLSIPLMIAPYFACPTSLLKREDQLQPKSKTQEEKHEKEGFKAQVLAFLAVLKHRKFLSVICLFAGSQMSFTVMTIAAPFIACHLLGGTEKDVAFILGPLLFMAIPSSALVPKLSKNLGWERSVALACAGLGLVYFGSIGLGLDLVYSPIATAAVLFALGGPMVSILLGLEGEAITACAEEVNGGVGIYFGVYNLIVKGANGFAFAITTFLAARVTEDPSQVKLMGLSASLMLIFGLGSYFLLRPKLDRKTP